MLARDLVELRTLADLVMAMPDRVWRTDPECLQTALSW
jgi:hypothetical protein